MALEDFSPDYEQGADELTPRLPEPASVGSAPPLSSFATQAIGPQGFADLEKQQKGLQAGADSAVKQLGESATLKRGLAEKVMGLKAPEPVPLERPTPPPAPPEMTPPMEAFSSTAALLGAIGAMFTRRPLTTAFNAMAGAMNSVRARDAEGFKRNYQTWQQQAQYVQQLQAWQNQSYTQAMQKYQGDLTGMQAAFQAIAAADNDVVMQQTIRSGAFDKALQLVKAREDTTLKFADEQRKIEDSFATQDLKRAQAEFYRAGGSRNGNLILFREMRDKENAERAQRGEAPMSAAEEQALQQHVNPTMFAAGKRAETANLNRQSRVDLANDKLAFQREKLDYTKDIDQRRLEQSQWWKENEIELRRQGLTQQQAKTEMLERTARLRLYGNTDQSIINELRYYPDLKPEDLGKIQPDQQKKVIAGLQTKELIEKVAEYAAQNPDAVGLIAELSKKANLDTLQGFSQNPVNWFRQASGSVESQLDKLNTSGAAKAKVLNKMLATLAFTDAAAFGRGGGTVYLDKAFRDIYQQNSNVPTFLQILRARYEDTDRLLSLHRLDMEKRNDAERHPFWHSGPEGYAALARDTELAMKAKMAPPTLVKTQGDFDLLGPGTTYYGVGENGKLYKGQK